MTDYHSILAKAVDALDPNTPRARQRIYERARSAMSSTIESTVPPINAADVATAKIALEAAITKVEAEAVHRNSAAASAAIASPLRPISEAAVRGERASGTKSGPRTWLTEVLERASDPAEPWRARDRDE
jgi:hypothetical protein